MPSAPEQTVEDLREESECAREALASTVTELRGKLEDTATELKTMVSPTHIKQEVRNYVRQERESLVQSLQRRAKDNPLQMAAIGAAVAYPALGILRAVPTPLWLIGAGLFLTSKRGQQAAKDVKAKADDVVRQGTEKVADFASSVQSDLEDRIAGARYGVEEARDAVSSKLGAITDTARATFQDARDALAGKAGDVAAKAGAAADDLKSDTADTANAVKNRAGEAVRSSRDAVTEFVNNNPLLVAGIGVAVGAFIAASIPPSESENRLFGAGSEKIKNSAREAAAQGIEKMSDIAAEAAGSAATAAAREGLDASGVQSALNKVADSVRAVADRGLDTVLGNQPQPHPETSSEQPISERNSP